MTQPDSIMSAEEFADKIPRWCGEDGWFSMGENFDGEDGEQEFIKAVLTRDEATRNTTLEEAASISENFSVYGNRIIANRIRKAKTPIKDLNAIRHTR